MAVNPYEPGNVTSTTPKTRVTRWLVWSGIASLALAVVCVVTTAVGMMLAVRSIATSSATPKASDLAHDISVATIPSMAVVPLAVLGLVLLVLGLIVRQPVDRP